MRMNKTAFKHSDLALGIALAFLLGMSGALQADTGQRAIDNDASVDGTDHSDIEEIEEIIVTGTLLRNVNPTSYVETITFEDIQKLGVVSAEDIVRSVSKNHAGASTAQLSMDNGQESFGRAKEGGSAANLRGLGTTATLVLVNGRRVAGMAAAGAEGAITNLANIPANAIERVEILLDGGSAIYGSDAIGGVINFILKKDYRGAETTVRYENSSNGGDLYSINQLIGVGWDSGNLTLSLNHKQTDPVSSADAGWTTTDLSSLGGTDRSTVFLSNNIFAGGFIPRTLPADNDGTNWTEADLVPTLPDDSPFYDIMTPETKSTGVTLTMEQELSDSVSLHMDAHYLENEISMPFGAPFLTQLVPASNAFNPFPFPVFVSYNMDQEVADGLVKPAHADNDSTQFDVAIGTTWDLPYGDWRLDFDVNYSKAVSKPAGTRIDFSGDPLFAELLASSDPAVALNLFGNGTAQSPRITELDWSSTFPDVTTSTQGARAIFEGGLVQLEGGMARLAIGAEYAEEAYHFSEGAPLFFDPSITKPKRQNMAGFFEASVPLIGAENRLPAVESFELSLGGRWQSYDYDSGGAAIEPTFSKFSPKVGLAWKPVEGWRFRATWSEAFRAPKYISMFRSSGVGSQTVFDPHNPGGGATVLIETRSGGNPDVGPETAESFTVGVDWQPASLDGLQASLTYNKIDFVDRITRIQPFGPLGELVLMNNDPRFVVRDSNGFMVAFNTISVNVAARHSESVDFNLNYEFETDAGMFDTGIVVTYTDELKDQIVEGAEYVQLAETIWGPDRWKARASLGWSKESYGANLFVNYSSSYEHDGRSFFNPVGGEAQRVDHYWTLDLTGYYETESGWSFQVGARNLLENDFPFVDDASGRPFDLSRVDVRGRVVHAQLKKAFDF